MNNNIDNMNMRVRKPGFEEIKEALSWGIWSREALEFPWYYYKKETCYILEGKASVTDSTGNTISFSTGDLVEFEPGLECNWKIEIPIQKRYKFE